MIDSIGAFKNAYSLISSRLSFSKIFTSDELLLKAYSLMIFKFLPSVMVVRFSLFVNARLPISSKLSGRFRVSRDEFAKVDSPIFVRLAGKFIFDMLVL